MADKTSTGRTSYQVHVSNSGRVFVWGHVNLYPGGLGCGFNTPKPKVRGKYEALGSEVYLIRDSQ